MGQRIFSWLSLALMVTCNVSHARVIDAGPVDAHASFQVRDGPQCPPNPGFINGGFETGSTNPWTMYEGSGQQPATIVSPGFHNSQYAAMFNGSDAGLYNQNVPVCQETNYQFSLYYKESRSELPTKAVYLKVGDWTHISINYSSYHKTFAAFYTFITSDSTPSAKMTVLVDNLELTEIGKLDAASCPQNVPIANPGFDTGALAPCFSTPGYQNSPYALQLSYPQGVPVGMDKPFEFALWQNTTGDCALYNYTTSFAVNWGNYPSPSGNPSTEGCYISASPGCYYSSGGGLPVYYAANASPGWQVHSFSCELSANKPAYLKLSVYCGVDDGHGYEPIPPFTMFIDAFNVSPVPS